MITNNPSQLKTILENLEVDNLAQETGFVLRRSRKINTTSFITSFFQMMILGKFSLRLWAANLSRMNGSCISSRQLRRNWIFDKSHFSMHCFRELLLAKCNAD